MNLEDQDTFIKEHKRLESIITDSESIWEERTFQIAAGGLSLTFAVFAFLAGKGQCFNWQMALIWGVYVFCILLNYVSHRVSIKNARKMQGYLDTRLEEGANYDVKSIEKEYSKFDKPVDFLNGFVQWMLIANVIYTIVFFSIYLLR